MTRTLLIYGDSNTHGTLPLTELGEIGRHPPGRRWTDLLAARLAPGWTVIAEGHPGRTTVHDDPIEGEHRNGARILPALLESHRPIDQLVRYSTTRGRGRDIRAVDVILGVKRGPTMLQRERDALT